MNVIIAGAGTSLRYLSNMFLEKGIGVTLIVSDENDAIDLKRKVHATVVQGDASNAAVLDDAGCMYADIIVAMTGRDEVNLAICQIARTMYNVPRALAIVNNPENEELFKTLGVVAFSTTRLFAQLIEERTLIEEVVTLMPIANGKMNVTEVKIDAGSYAADKRLADLRLPGNSLLACVIREGNPIIPRGDTSLSGGDRVILFTLPESHADVLRYFINQEGEPAV